MILQERGRRTEEIYHALFKKMIIYCSGIFISYRQYHLLQQEQKYSPPIRQQSSYVRSYHHAPAATQPLLRAATGARRQQAGVCGVWYHHQPLAGARSAQQSQLRKDLVNILRACNPLVVARYKRYDFCRRGSRSQQIRRNKYFVIIYYPHHLRTTTTTPLLLLPLPTHLVLVVQQYQQQQQYYYYYYLLTTTITLRTTTVVLLQQYYYCTTATASILTSLRAHHTSRVGDQGYLLNA